MKTISQTLSKHDVKDGEYGIIELLEILHNYVQADIDIYGHTQLLENILNSCSNWILDENESIYE